MSREWCNKLVRKLVVRVDAHLSRESSQVSSVRENVLLQLVSLHVVRVERRTQLVSNVAQHVVPDLASNPVEMPVNDVVDTDAHLYAIEKNLDEKSTRALGFLQKCNTSSRVSASDSPCNLSYNSMRFETIVGVKYMPSFSRAISTSLT